MDSSIDPTFDIFDAIQHGSGLMELTPGTDTIVSDVVQSMNSPATTAESFFSMGQNLSQVADSFSADQGFPSTEGEAFSVPYNPGHTPGDGLPSYMSLGGRPTKPPTDPQASQFLPSPTQPTVTSSKPATQLDITTAAAISMASREAVAMVTSPGGSSHHTPQPASTSGSPCLSPQGDVHSPHTSTVHSPGYYAPPPGRPDVEGGGAISNGVGYQGLGAATSASHQEMPSSTMEERKRTRNTGIAEMKLAGRRCAVCEDAASGFHYGVWSCEGCKAFFKRSLQGPNDYVCPATNTCTIDRSRRKSCPSCRLRKCIETGMSRGNCRERRTSTNPAKPKQPNKRRASDTLELGHSQIKKEVLDPCFNFNGSGDDDPISIDSLPRAPPPDPSRPLPMHPLVEHLMGIDPPVRFSNHDPTLPDNEMNLLTSMLKLADFELVDVITWAKSVPGYNSLSLSLRIHLLEASWMEVLNLGLLWRSMQADDKLIFAPDLHFDRKRMTLANICHTCFPLLKLVKVFKKLNVTREEMVLLRIVLLLNADVISEEEQGKVSALQEAVEEAMEYTVVRRGHQPPSRIQRLLLLLPHIRHCALNAIAHVHDIKQEATVPIMDLLREMMDGRKIVPPGSSAVGSPTQGSTAVHGLSPKHGD